MKRFLAFFGIVLLILCMSSLMMAFAGSAVRTLVIDPGHGGRDSGAIGRHSREKDVALAISLKLGEYVRENLPEVEVIFTRETDVFVPLHERAQIANDNNADLFISIHCNSTNSSRARGTETFVMGLHRSQANLEVARRENKSILYEDDYLETYDGFDPNSPEANIIFALYQNAYLDQSLNMASLVQHQFRNRARRIDRGVKQAGFLVLYQIAMPGILVETGFLSNPNEEQFLTSETGQAYIASAIYRAFRDYKEEQDELFAARNDYPYGQSTTNTVYHEETTAAQNNERVTRTNESEKGDAGSIVFRVQFASTSEKRPYDDPVFRGMENVSSYFHEGLHKYTVGNEPTLEKAAEVQKNVQDAGFQDAFVVAFINEERISATEAIELLKKQGAD